MLREQLRPHATKRGQRLALVWERGRVFDEQASEAFRQIVVEGHSLRVGAAEMLPPTKHAQLHLTRTSDALPAKR